ncbi:MAG: DNA polymerase III subunit delta [Phycisphaerales bacterium]
MARTARHTATDESAALDSSRRVVVLHGSELFLRSEKTRQLTASLVEAHGEIGRFEFDGETVAAATVLDELRSFGLMQPHKLVIVDDADRFLARDNSRRLLESYCEAPMREATLLLRATTWRAGNIDRLIAGIGTIIACEPPRRTEDAVSWAIARCAEACGQRLARDAAELLVQRVGLHLARLDTEIAKVATLAGTGQPVTLAEVRELTPISRDEVAWAIQAPLLDGDAPATIATLHELVAVSRISEVLLTFAMVDTMRKLHDGAALASEGAGAWDVAKAAKIWGSDRDRMLAAISRNAKRLPRARIAALLHAAVRTEQRTRNGESTNTRRALEALAVRTGVVLGSGAAT